ARRDDHAAPRAHLEGAQLRAGLRVVHGAAHRDRAAALEHDALRVAARVEARAVGDGARDVRDVHALSRADRTALEARPVALAALGVAVDAPTRQAERLGRALHEEVVAAEHRSVGLVHAELVLDALERALERGAADELLEPEAGDPVGAHVLGHAPDDPRV